MKTLPSHLALLALVPIAAASGCGSTGAGRSGSTVEVVRLSGGEGRAVRGGPNAWILREGSGDVHADPS